MTELTYWNSPLLASVGVTGRFYGRFGGFSQGHLASLNLGIHENDNPDHLAANETLILNHLGAQSLYLPRQVHGKQVQIVRTAEPGVVRGPEADAVWTDVPGVAVGVLTADCVPILLTTDQGDFIGAIHAGWRGLMAGIVGEAVQYVAKLFCCRTYDLLAAIGPAIGTEQYEVSKDLGQQFLNHKPELEGVIWPDKRQKPHLDLRRMVLNDLLANGLCRECVEYVGPNTADPRCFSHRRDKGKTGRQLSVAFKS